MTIHPLIKLSILFASFSLISACASYQGDDWPRLDEGFDLRPAITPMAASEVATTAPPASDEETSQQNPEVVRLMAEIALQKQKYTIAIEQIKNSDTENMQRHWFSAQLEFSRLNSLRDDLLAQRPQQSDDMTLYLSNLQGYLAAASDEVYGLEP